MLNQLKFDFYKAIKSKSIIIAFIASFCIFIIRTFLYLLSVDDSSVVNNWSSEPLTINMLIFATFYCSKDFSSDYLKNVYTSTSKLKYVISKTLVLTAYVILYFLITFLVLLLINVILGPGVIVYTGKIIEYGAPLDDRIDALNFVGTIFSQIIGSVAWGLLLNLFCVLANRFVVAIGAFVWYFLRTDIIFYIDEIIIKKYNITDMRFSIGDYTLIDNLNNTYNFIHTNSYYNFTTALIVYLIVLVIAFLLSWLAMCKKNF